MAKSAAGAGNIRQRSDGRWEARVITGHDPGTGKAIRRSIYGQTQKEVRQKLSKLTVELDEGTYKNPQKITVGEWLDIWLAEYLPDVKPRTKDSYASTVKNHIKPALGAIKLEELTTPAIQAFYNRLQQGTAPLSAKTLRNVHGVLHRSLQQAVEIDYLRANPATFAKLPRVKKSEIKPLDDEGIKAFLEAIKGHKYESFYLVSLFTGARESELLGLQWSCVDFKEGTILIDKQLQRKRGGKGAYWFVDPKNNKTRKLCPAPFVMDVLRDQRKRQLEWRLKAGELWDNSMNLVFTNELGRNLSSQTIYLHFKKLVAEAGYPDTRLHDLRHSYAVTALRSGDDIKTVQEALGHHTAAFTMDTYLHVTEQMKKDSSQRMQNFIDTLKQA